ncbi:hypothetical protein BS50DRAFT_185038 [Corynespora cassiicola Philippines]|uniref:N-acetyltransferase domain-containing protein n=1 Tax=Corynespora cassiicola Philippines TaxID=1448308 RepID=A0A2T2P6J4_CORCC|nr:hypothetical protein BS50DRAFT_185038 [Corynespora cassiicola Philippines]
MTLKLCAMTVEDTLSWTRIRSLAYAGPTHNLIHAGPISESSIRGVAMDRKKEIGKPHSWHWKVVDTDRQPSAEDPPDNGGRTIAFAVWSAHNLPSPKEPAAETTNKTKIPKIDASQAENEPEVVEEPFLPPELKPEILSALLTPLNKARKEIMGDKPYFMLNSLATHPDYRGRGAANMLLDWGMCKADEERWTTYLDTSHMGRKIYEKKGFRLIRELDFDRTLWGGEGMDWHGCMLREGRNI